VTGVGALLGLDPGVPDPNQNVVALRYSLTLGALVWAWLTARARPVASLVAGVVWFACATGFWVLCLGRPWGLFEDVATARRAAEIGVAAASGGTTEGVLPGTPAAYASWTAWLSRGISAEALILLPSLLPLVVVPAVAVLLFALVRPREHAPIAATLWLLLSTADLDAVRGLGFLPELWRRPGAGLGVVVVTAVVLALARLRIAATVSLALCALPPVVASALAAPGETLAASDALLVLTLDQGLLLPLAVLGLARRPDAATQGLILGGALSVLSGTAAPVTDAWLAHACYRLGLILASAGALGDVLEPAGAWLQSFWSESWFGRIDTQRLGAAALVAVLAPASFVAWWTPPKLDVVFESSRAPFPRGLTDAMDWIQQMTPADAIFLASDEQAPAVATLGGRRLLRAPRLREPPDDARRADAERRLLWGRRQRDWVQEYGVRYIFAAPGEFVEIEAQEAEDSVVPYGRRLVYSNMKGYRVYGIVSGPLSRRRASPASTLQETPAHP